MTLNDVVSLTGIIILGITGLYFNYKFNQIGKDNDWSSAKSKR